MKKHDFLFITICFTIISLQLSFYYYNLKNEQDLNEKVQKYRFEIIRLKEDLHTQEVMYLKCQGDIEAEKYGAHYSDGKLKFYKTK